jgi:hypothetical protein
MGVFSVVCWSASRWLIWQTALPFQLYKSTADFAFNESSSTQQHQSLERVITRKRVLRLTNIITSHFTHCSSALLFFPPWVEPLVTLGLDRSKFKVNQQALVSVS